MRIGAPTLLQVFLLPVVLAAATPTFASVVCVPNAAIDGTCTSGALTIQAAIDAAAAGDTVLVAPGIYPETVTAGHGGVATGAPGLDIDKSLTLKSQSGALVTTITAAGGHCLPTSCPGGPISAVTLSASGITIDGFTILETDPPTNLITADGAAASDNHAIKNNTIKHAGFDDGNAGGGWAILLGFGDADNNTISGNDISLNPDLTKGQFTFGVWFQGGGSDGNAVSGNTIHDVGNGIIVDATDTGTVISGNTITHNARAGLVDFGATGTQVSNNLFDDNGRSGVEVRNGATNALIQNNCFLNNGVNPPTFAPCGSGCTVTPFGGIRIDDTGTTGTMMHSNNFSGNLPNGVTDLTAASTNTDGAAENNWWGCPTGANTAGCDSTTANVDADPFLDAPVPNSPCAASIATPTPIVLATPTATATPLPPLNHFHCYEVHAPNNIISGISLADQFGPSTVQLIEPRRFCAPANKNDEDPTAVTDPDHLAGYRLRQTTPKFNRIRGYFADNQFGTTSIDILRPEYLMAPSAKSLAAPPPPPLAGPVTDHFKCYRVSGRKSVRGVKVQDQFGTQTVDLKRPRRLCVPADKNGEGILDAETHLLCYQVRRASGFTQPPGTIFINNQFGQDEFELFRPTELCVPSLKRGPGSTPRPSATRTLTPIATPTLTVVPSETPTPVATTTPEPTLTAVLATSTPEPTLTPVLATSTPEPTLTPVLATSTPEPTLTAVLATSTPEPTLTPVLATSTPEPTLTAVLATSTPEPTLTPPDDATSTPTPAPTPISCSFDQNEQSCGNDCPPGFECSQTGPNPDDCFCVALPPCGLDAGTCGGSCPNVGDLCLFVTDVAACACVPPSSACEAATIPTCNGFCPNVADPCVPGNIDPSVCACGGVQ